jgi:hypothetical protein
MIERCETNFSQRILYINNVSNIRQVSRYAQQKVDAGIIDKYVIVEQYAAEALSFFGLQKEDFKGGYYYSIAELVGIYLCRTDFLLHFSSDAILIKGSNNWIEKGTSLLQENDSIMVANPNWSEQNNEALAEAISAKDGWAYGFGFSDQCYLVRTADVRKPIYSTSHPDSERYPKYGGELFEKRVDACMRNANQMRITYLQERYRHKNFRKTTSVIRKYLHLLHRFIKQY